MSEGHTKTFNFQLSIFNLLPRSAAFWRCVYRMSFVKYRVKEVAADFGVAPKEIVEIISKFFEKPKSNTQVLTDDELNVVFDYITQTNQISSLEVVFAVQPAPKAEEPKKEEPKKDSVKVEKPKEEIYNPIY